MRVEIHDAYAAQLDKQISKLQDYIKHLDTKLSLAKEALEAYAANPYSGATAREALEKLK